MDSIFQNRAQENPCAEGEPDVSTSFESEALCRVSRDQGWAWRKQTGSARIAQASTGLEIAK
jgi:hypothetical protein